MIDWFVAFEAGPEGEAPALVGAVYTRREPFGEYIFHASGDPASRDRNDPLKLDGSSVRAGREVTISFEPSTVDVARGEIERAQNIGDDAFHYESSVHGELTSAEVLDSYGHDGHAMLPIDRGYLSASWVDVTRHAPRLEATLTVFHKRLDDDGVVEIMAYVSGDATIVEELVDSWRGLYKRYGSMSMRELSGASVM